MNNFGNNNSKSYVDNTNSRGITFLNSSAEFKSALAIGFWNEMVSFRWHPPLPENQRTEKKFFNYDESISTSLGYSKLLTFVNAIKTVIIPAMKDGVKKTVGVPISENTAAMVISSGENGKAPFVAIYKDLNEQRIPSSQMLYIFDKGILINEYNPTDGTCEIIDEQAEFNAFVKYLEACLIGMCNAFYHSHKHSDRFFRSKLVGEGNSNGGTYNKKSNVWGSTNNTSGNTGGNNNDYGNSQNINNVDDLNDFM